MNKKILATVEALPNGAPVRVFVKPQHYWECAMLFRALGRGLDAQWIDGTLHKLGPHTSFFSITGECSRLPLTRVYRRGNRNLKTAVYHYILDIEGAP